MAQDILIKLKKKSWKKDFQRASAQFISDRSEIISQLLILPNKTKSVLNIGNPLLDAT